MDPVEEKEVGESGYKFPAGDKEIVAQIQHEQAVAQGKVIDVDSDSDGKEDTWTELSTAKMIQMCERLEKASLTSEIESSLDVLWNL